MKSIRTVGALLATAGLLILSTAAQAQTTSSSNTSSSGSSSRMWGSTSSSGSATTDSSTIHSQDGVAAGQVNAARRGLLLDGGPGMTITSIGSQTIVSTNIVGNNNSATVNATQTSSNAGNVSNNGTIALTSQ